MYKVFDTETRELYYEAIVYGVSRRGSVSVANRFSSEYKSEVKKWRNSTGIN